MRLIDADALKEAIFDLIEDEWLGLTENDAVQNEIDNLPTIDAVEVVRCKDCKYHITHDKMNGCKIWWGWTKDDNRFCSYGERKGE